MTLELWASNFGSTRKVKIEVYAMDLNTTWKSSPKTYEVELAENRSMEVWKGECPAPTEDEAYDRFAPSGSVVIHARLHTEDGMIAARTSNWPEPYKFLQLPDPKLQVIVGTQGEEVTISGENPCKGVWLDVEGDNDGVEWSDNGVS